MLLTWTGFTPTLDGWWQSSEFVQGVFVDDDDDELEEVGVEVEEVALM